jgi:hypothetical protein
MLVCEGAPRTTVVGRVPEESLCPSAVGFAPLGFVWSVDGSFSTERSKQLDASQEQVSKEIKFDKASPNYLGGTTPHLGSRSR